MTYLKPIAFLFILCMGFVSTAQCECNANMEDGWCWGTDSDKAKEQNALYTDAYKVENFKEAATSLEWLLENTPCLNKSIYINGAKIYEDLANLETDKAAKLTLALRSLEMYDLRIKYFGEETNVLNRKAYSAYKLLKGNKDKYQELLDLFDKSYELNGNKFFPNNIIGYMDVMRRYKAVGNPLSDDKVFEVYFGLSDLMDYKETTGKPVPASIRDNVDKLLLMIVPEIDCEIVIKDFGPKLEANPDINMAKKIFKLMLTGKCTDDPLALKAAKMVDDNEPSYGIKVFIAGRSMADGDKETAITYFENAIDLTDENVKKADIHLKIAKVKNSRGLKSQARESANKALSLDPTLKDAHKLIGDLYMNSFDDCARKEDMVQDRLVFIAARDAYNRAGAYSAASKAKEQFPSKEEIFTANVYKVGQTLTVNCWINKAVVLETRD